MSDMVNFVDEQEARMNLPDEAFEDYIARMVLAMNKDVTLPIKTRKSRDLEQKEEGPADSEPPAKRRKIDGVPKAKATDAAHRHNTNQVSTTGKSRSPPVVQTTPETFSGLKDPKSNDRRKDSSHDVPERDGHENLASKAHCTTPSASLSLASHQGPKIDKEQHVHRPTTPASSLINVDETTRKGSGARSSSRASKSTFAPQATSTQLLKSATLTPQISTPPNFADSPSSVITRIFDIPASSDPQTTSPIARPINPESQPGFLNLHASMTSRESSSPPEATALRSSNEGAASRPKPRVIPQKAVQPLAASPSMKKMSKFSVAQGGSKRDKVIKSTPKPSLEVDTSVVTTPGAHPFSLSSGISSLSSKLISSAAPSAGPSRNKITASTERTSATSKGKQKEKLLVTPLEYAQVLSKKLEIFAKKADFLKGKKLFYTGGDMQYASQSTRKRMELIIQNGGELIPKYDPEHITHIISDAPERPTLRALKLASLTDVAAHIPIVTWKWIVEGRGREGLPEIEYAAFHKHLVQTVPGLERPRSRAQRETSMDLSRISQFTQDKSTVKGPQKEKNPSAIAQLLETSKHPRSTPEVTNEDPLAEFYDLAVAEQEDDTSDHYDEDLHSPGHEEESEDSLSYEEYLAKAGPPIKKGFTCDTKVNRPEGSKNQDIADKLEELMELHKSKPSKDDFWRGFSYGKSLGPIRNHPRRIRSYAEARSIRGVGHKTAEKIMEIIETGGLRRIAFEHTDDVEAVKAFSGIYGVGRTTAYQWYSNGCRSLDDVREGKGGVKLSPVMEIGLAFYDDINSRMPREEAEEIFNLIRPIALQLDPKLFVEIMGSFRRGKMDCGDIDVLITRPTDDNKTHAGIIPRLLRDLHLAGIVTEDLALPDDMQSLEVIYRGLCKLPDRVDEYGKIVSSKRRRLDFLSVPWKHRGAALLYYTGDDIFNRAMRFKANKMGYSLNQRGLYSGVVRDPKDRRVKTSAGSLVASETEKEIFDILGVPWQEPHERIRSK